MTGMKLYKVLQKLQPGCLVIVTSVCLNLAIACSAGGPAPPQFEIGEGVAGLVGMLKKYGIPAPADSTAIQYVHRKSWSGSSLVIRFTIQERQLSSYLAALGVREAQLRDGWNPLVERIALEHTSWHVERIASYAGVYGKGAFFLCHESRFWLINRNLIAVLSMLSP
jgi:hypothetical protein